MNKAELIKLLEPYGDECAIHVVNTDGLDLREATRVGPIWPGDRLFPTRRQKKESMVVSRLVIE